MPDPSKDKNKKPILPKVIIACIIVLVLAAIVVSFVPGFIGWFDPLSS